MDAPDLEVTKEAPNGMTEGQFLGVAGAVVGAYLGALLMLHCGYLQIYGDVRHDFKTTYVWDHPEPNFTVSLAITEFWSVVTAIPLAGSLLCYLGLRYTLDAPVVAVFVGTFLMYNFALVSHLTLSKPFFQLTLTSVMTNCFSAFLLYGFLAGDLADRVPPLARLACQKCRAGVALPSVALVALAAVRLPDHLGPGGGVWTLFYVQAPPVWVATLAGVALMFGSPRDNLRPGYKMVSWAGAFLSLAMFLSYVECRMGVAAVLTQPWCLGFPALHVAIHLSEQVGIYLYGLSLAFLHEVQVSPRSGAEFRWLFGGTVPYFVCGRPAALAGVTPAACGDACKVW